jgi:hypothetical protein
MKDKIALEAKQILEQLRAVTFDREQHLPKRTQAFKFIHILSGLLIETLLEYEEPDVVMDQTFHRISDLMRIEPFVGDLNKEMMLPIYQRDEDIEFGRKLAKTWAETLPKAMDDIHEIAIGIILSEFSQQEMMDLSPPQSFQMLIDSVIEGLMTEMAVQEVCDNLIEGFIDKGWALTRAVEALAGASGFYLKKEYEHTQKDISEFLPHMLRLIALESFRFGIKGYEDWWQGGPANDAVSSDIKSYISELTEHQKEFFEMIGLESNIHKSLVVAKATGRMVAASSHKDVGQMQITVAKSLAKSGLISGAL